MSARAPGVIHKKFDAWPDLAGFSMFINSGILQMYMYVNNQVWPCLAKPGQAWPGLPGLGQAWPGLARPGRYEQKEKRVKYMYICVSILYIYTYVCCIYIYMDIYMCM